MSARKKSESEMVKDLLNGFKYDTSDAWKLILEKLGRTLNHNELLHLANLFEKTYFISPNRYEKRNKELMVKLFNNNLEKFKDFMSRIAYKDNKGNSGGPMEGALVDQEPDMTTQAASTTSTNQDTDPDMFLFDPGLNQ